MFAPKAALKAVFLILGVLAGEAALARASQDCLNRAVGVLRQDSPIGYRVWTTSTDKNNFYEFTECGRDTFHGSIPTAVHESVHMIRANKEAYLLASGEMVKVPNDDGYFKPRKMAANVARDLKIAKGDTYYTTYIAPKGSDAASSSVQLSYLLDELNAYTVDLKVSTDIANKGRHVVNPQNHGQSALMSYLAYYLQHAQNLEPATWERLSGDPEMQAAIRKIWNQAEIALAESCESSNVGHDPNMTKNYVSYLCDSARTSALAKILGRRARCPEACRGGGGGSREQMIILPAESADASR